MVYDSIQSTLMPKQGWWLAFYDLEVMFCMMIAENTMDWLKSRCWHALVSSLRKAILDCALAENTMIALVVHLILYGY